MSNIALSWAFKCHVGNASAKAVLVYLADRADDDGTAAYPKIATIVNITELSERTVRTALKTLQERGFIRRGDQRYARLGKGGRNRLPQYCQIVWDLAVESDPSTLEWIKETHTAEHDPKTMGNTVDPAASTIMENGESTVEAAQRETFEEACAQVKIDALFSLVSIPHIDQVHLFYRGRMLDADFSAGIESLETALFSETDIPWQEIAFRSVTLCLKSYLADRRNGQFGFHEEVLPPSDDY